MATSPTAMSNEKFYGYAYPLQNRRYYLALVCSIVLFPLIAVGLIAGTVFLIVPFVALMLWVGMRIFFANMLGNSILVSAENYPRIFAITEELKAKLDYPKPIYVFVYEDGSFNAYMRHIFFRRAIFLNSELLQTGVTDQEMRWLIGRFVGYMRARKQGGVLGWVIRAAQQLLVFNFFILPYERSMVYTGDRLALAEIDGDLTSAISAMQKLLVGRELGYSINPEGLIAQHRQVKGSIFGFLARMGKAYPHTTARYVDLVLFAKAFFPEQFKIFEAANPGLPEDLAQLGLPQQAEATAPQLAHAPWGWTLAGGTLVVLLALATLTTLAMTRFVAAASETDRLGFDATPTPAAYEIGAPASAPADLPPFQPPSPASPPQLQSAPPRTHFTAAGALEPDQGCSWMTDLPNDFRVVCR